MKELENRALKNLGRTIYTKEPLRRLGSPPRKGKSNKTIDGLNNVKTGLEKYIIEEFPVRVND
jgi:hypothetical protein